MNTLITKLVGDKRDWKAMEVRAHALPRDYRVVYTEMTSYLWRFTAGDGMDIVALLKEVLDVFETGAAEGKGVMAVTGEDVAAFCDQRLRGTTSYVDRWRATLNQDVAHKLAQ